MINCICALFQMILLFVDGAYDHGFECTVSTALTGLAPMVPPPNTVIAFSSKPGCIRQIDEAL